MLDCVFMEPDIQYIPDLVIITLMTCPDNLLPVCNSAYIQGWVRANCHTVLFIRATQVSSPPKFMKNIHIYKHVDLIKAENKFF